MAWYWFCLYLKLFWEEQEDGEHTPHVLTPLQAFSTVSVTEEKLGNRQCMNASETQGILSWKLAFSRILDFLLTVECPERPRLCHHDKLK